ncbi:enterobactin synthase subunit EntD [Providencia burhodogranariea]|uniref:Enterobactin synthase component D n=1 Tax=Providencia burhodogranariea DSM 19968 TaxID=1141662 RepID=K8WNS4_9GAMM|nr:enterobactin synthase subunit EntD [Providencia burhodogranariea]EKT62219.1 4'-phosphopantetheinyl transferase [Providencia burhodogranariea DSM 19968]
METHYSTLSLANHTLHSIRYDPITFSPDDLLWIPHHEKLNRAIVKRQAEHLAGRIAASYAIKQLTGCIEVLKMGDQNEPIWPSGIRGSISHDNNLALSIALNNRDALVGIDIETILNEFGAKQIWQEVITLDEQKQFGDLPFSLGVILAFSAKESLYKALHCHVNRFFDFFSAEVIQITQNTLTLKLTETLAIFPVGAKFTLHWQQLGQQVITLLCCTSFKNYHQFDERDS